MKIPFAAIASTRSSFLAIYGDRSNGKCSSIDPSILIPSSP
jgi:hypothetical protein